MTDDGGLQSNSWRDCCSWLMIFRSFGISISFSVLLLATAGALLTPVGWLIGSKVFVSASKSDPTFHDIVEHNNRCPWQDQDVPIVKQHGLPNDNSIRWSGLFRLPSLWYERFVLPFQRLFVLEDEASTSSDAGVSSLSKFAYFLFGGLWTLLVWAFFGGAITRIASMQLGREERVGLKGAVEHACRRYGAYVAAPVLPLLGVVLVASPVAVLGLFMMANWGVALAGIFWIFVLVAGFIMALLLLGLTFGWPLMFVTVSTEGNGGGDAFDAISRSYAYTFQRPLHYLFYAVVASIFGLVCWSLVYMFSEAVIALSYWAASWGANFGSVFQQESARIGENGVNGNTEGILGFGTIAIDIGNGFVRLLAMAFSYSFFWCAVSAIYLLLRQDVDQTEFDEVWVEDEEQQFGLPPIKPDKDGVPNLADNPSEGSGKDESKTNRESAPENDDEKQDSANGNSIADDN